MCNLLKKVRDWYNKMIVYRKLIVKYIKICVICLKKLGIGIVFFRRYNEWIYVVIKNVIGIK